MAEVIRHIGLSLGADLCWPICFEQMMKRLDLRIPSGGDTLRFEVERVTIEPFDLRQPCKYDVVVDRLTHWYATSREWIKKSIGTQVCRCRKASHELKSHPKKALMVSVTLRRCSTSAAGMKSVFIV